MRRLRLTIAYEGGNYVGWQRQKTGPSVQAAIEDALFAMTQEKQPLRGASRTDAGVHAEGQVAHFDTEKTIATYGFFRGLNTMLPPDIRIMDVCEVPPTFDSRLSNIGKLYRYRLYRERVALPGDARIAWLLNHRIDLQAMRLAARHFAGTHDFAAFRAADCERLTTVRVVRRVDVVGHGKRIAIDVEGEGFLKNMVRIMVGSLVDVGLGKATPEHIAHLLQTGDRTQAGPTAPAHGLTLVKVLY